MNSRNGTSGFQMMHWVQALDSRTSFVGSVRFPPSIRSNDLSSRRVERQSRRFYGSGAGVSWNPNTAPRVRVFMARRRSCSTLPDATTSSMRLYHLMLSTTHDAPEVPLWVLLPSGIHRFHLRHRQIKLMGTTPNHLALLRAVKRRFRIQGLCRKTLG